MITPVALLKLQLSHLHKGLPHHSCTLIQPSEDRVFQTGSQTVVRYWVCLFGLHASGVRMQETRTRYFSNVCEIMVHMVCLLTGSVQCVFVTS
jgi:hypothetical protein